MTIVFSAILVLSAVPPVKGGNAAQREKVQSAVDAVPACLRSCDGGVQVRVTNEAPGWWKKEWGPFPELKGKPDAFHVSHPTNDDKNVIVVTPTLASNTAATEERYAENFCGTQEEMKDYLSNLDSWMLHEHAHHFQMSCKGGEKLVKEFLKIRYQKLIKKLMKDPAWKTLDASYRDIWENPKLSTKEKRAKACKLTEKRAKLMEKHELPSRHSGDAHCVDNDGKEYFAIALQTLVHDPEEFCRAFSEKEQDFLQAKFGECLSGTATAPCFSDAARKPLGEFPQP